MAAGEGGGGVRSPIILGVSGHAFNLKKLKTKFSES